MLLIVCLYLVVFTVDFVFLLLLWLTGMAGCVESWEVLLLHEYWNWMIQAMGYLDK